MEPKQWPVTIDEALGVVIATLTDEDKATIAAMAEPMKNLIRASTNFTSRLNCSGFVFE